MTPLLTVRQPGRRVLQLVLDGELVIGRECDGLLIADDRMSRSHLRVRPMGDRVEVHDLGSTNGTLVLGERISEPTLVGDGAVVTAGTTSIIVRVVGDSRVPSNPRGTTVTQTAVGKTSIDRVAESLPDGDTVDADARWGPTTTIVFSDIEASTSQLTGAGDRDWFRTLEHHNEVVRSALSRFGGKEIQFVGDGFMVTFPSARRAIGFAVAVQQGMNDQDGPGLRVRIGIHTGEAIETVAGFLVGRHVNHAARIANVAAGGEIVVSNTVREIAEAWEELAFGPPMSAELKGFSEPQLCHQLLWG